MCDRRPPRPEYRGPAEPRPGLDSRYRARTGARPDRNINPMCKSNDDDSPAPRHWPPPADGDYQPGPWVGPFFAPVALALALVGCAGGSDDDGSKPGPVRRFRDFMNEPVDDARAPRNGPRPAPPFHWARRLVLACQGGPDDIPRGRTPSGPATTTSNADPNPWPGRPRVRSRGTTGPWSFRAIVDLVLHRHPAYAPAPARRD